MMSMNSLTTTAVEDILAYVRYENNIKETREMFQLCKKILRNVAKYPSSEKYKRLNAKKGSALSKKGGTELLNIIGFKKMKSSESSGSCSSKYIYQEEVENNKEMLEIYIIMIDSLLPSTEEEEKKYEEEEKEKEQEKEEDCSIYLMKICSRTKEGNDDNTHHHAFKTLKCCNKKVHTNCLLSWYQSDKNENKKNCFMCNQPINIRNLLLTKGNGRKKDTTSTMSEYDVRMEKLRTERKAKKQEKARLLEQFKMDSKRRKDKPKISQNSIAEKRQFGTKFTTYKDIGISLRTGGGG